MKCAVTFIVLLSVALANALNSFRSYHGGFDTDYGHEHVEISHAKLAKVSFVKTPVISAYYVKKPIVSYISKPVKSVSYVSKPVVSLHTIPIISYGHGLW
ncbi:hypothetical protein BIW11_06042 [Tropilaelaps mercedesae]|uniref:Uncharacterized protein n=1 Tax=Tropilaelaps mercedesae TaxID=418985 RepID=A0A1V9XZQ3_9ACAR|nr:hypothetical protein BIW11_06042 [Tropilaelaps mercedesae]